MNKIGPYSILFFYFCVIHLLNACSAEEPLPDVLPGAYNTDIYLPLVAGKKTGMVINHTSLIGTRNLADTLMDLGVDIKVIYSPEHGLKGSAAAGEKVSDGTYSSKSIPVISLYGKKKKPDKQDLAGIEIVIFDLQDVGVRFYTYISTLHYVMEACAENQVPLIVLDRPNPNGFYIDGPVLDTAYRSFIGMHRVPVVYGMTIGEYAGMINGERWLSNHVQCELTIIPCYNYTHSSHYSLPVPPSPNLPGMGAVYLYPSTGFFEGTVVSEGRGTRYPFQNIGHPGYRDHSFSFTPRSVKGYSLNPKFQDIKCFGIDLTGIPLDSLQNRTSINLGYLIHFYDELATGEKFFTDFFKLLAGNNILKEQIISGISASDIRQSWQKDIEDFKKIRVKYLLYPDF